MSVALAKYADLYAGLDALKALSPRAAAGAYLLSGEDADGLNVLARLVAARLCGISDERALGELADISVYPKPEEEKKPKKGKKAESKARANVMKVSDVEDMLDTLYLTPFELDRRVIIIQSAETMSEILQNKLLKSLEEPPPRVCFILCASGAMLPTVESRCLTIHLPPFSVDTVKERLSACHKDREAIALAARASRGNLGLAERILADKDFAGTYADALKLLSATGGSRMFAKAAAVYEKFNRDKADGVLGVMEYLLNDIARMLSGSDTVFDAADVKAASAGFTPLSAANSAEFVRAAKRRNAANCMIPALMDEMILKIMEEKSLCRK